MFPIHDARGQVIGFGGRVLGDGEPKYLNSPETPLFSKGHELYGLFLARAAIRSAGTVVVVEGYMDVVALAQHGVDYAVATLGTSTTPAHVQKLFRQSDRVIFCFDGDAAGARRRGARSRTRCRCWRTARTPRFCSCPTARIRTTSCAGAARRRSRRCSRRDPASEFLLAELSRQHPPDVGRGRAPW
jgi:DNA primase